MKFGECFARLEGRRPVISFEVYPPRSAAAERKFQTVVPELVALGPDLVTVTYGAMGSTRDRTVEIARQIKAEHDIETACHLTCVGSTREEIDEILDSITRGNIQNVVALRGDPPSGESEFRPVEGGYSHGVDLVRHIRKRGGFGVAVAGYPEKHMEAPDKDTDLRHLVTKVEAGADIVVTQLFFENPSYFEFVERARALGIRCPIVPGILPVLSRKQILRISAMCGAHVPAQLLAELEEAGDDHEKARNAGIRQAVRQVRELLERGAPGVHFYVLNNSIHMQSIIREIPVNLLGK